MHLEFVRKFAHLFTVGFKPTRRVRQSSTAEPSVCNINDFKVLFSLTSQNISLLKVPFPTEREAVIALRSLSPDPEPRKGGIAKNMDVSGQTLSVYV